MTLTEEIKEIHERMNRQIQERLEAASRSVDEAIGDNPNIRRLSRNCFVMNSSELTKHGNWSPEFHDFRAQAEIFKAAFFCVKPDKIEKYFRHIVEKGALPRSPVIKTPEKVLYDGGYAYYIHPQVRQIIKDEMGL